MYIIVAYDIQIERIDVVRKYLKRYINWVQNSLFEGEVTAAELEEIKSSLSSLIDKDKDYIIIYKLHSINQIMKENIGTAKVDNSNII